MRAFLVAAGATLFGALVYGLVVVGLFRFDARDLQVDGAVVVVAVLLYALPFAAGAWLGTRSGLRAGPSGRAAAFGAAGALLALVVLTLFSLGAGGSDLLGVLVPLAGVAAGAVLALRAGPPR